MPLVSVIMPYYKKIDFQTRDSQSVFHQINDYESKALKSPVIETMSKSLFWPQ